MKNVVMIVIMKNMFSNIVWMKILEVLMKNVKPNTKTVNVNLSVKKTKLQLKHLICNSNSGKEFNEDIF